jgi:hypothetical protein
MNKPEPTEGKQRWWTRFITYPNAFIGIGLLLLYQERTLLGVGFVLAGLISRLEALIRIPEKEERKSNRDNRLTDKAKEESVSFGFNLTRPWIAADSGWENATLYPAHCRYEETYCFGKPPVIKEVWKYDIKEEAFIFHRLLDRHEEDLYGREFEVVNGIVLEAVFEQKNREHELWLNSLSEEEKAGFRAPPYSAEEIEKLRRETEWHELHGAMKYFILSRHYPYGEWRRNVRDLRASCSQITTEAEALGATLGRYRDYELPKEADDIQRQKLKELFSEKTLLNKYRIRSFRDWVDRDLIFKLLDEDVGKEPAVDA